MHCPHPPTHTHARTHTHFLRDEISLTEEYVNVYLCVSVCKKETLSHTNWYEQGRVSPLTELNMSLTPRMLHTHPLTSHSSMLFPAS